MCTTILRSALGNASRRACPALLAALGVSLLCLCASVGAARPAAPRTENHPAAPSPETPAVKVTTSREGERTRFWAENTEFCEVTMTFEMGLVNLKGDVQFPYTIAIPARQKTELFALSPCQPGTDWEYNFTNSYKLGSNCVKHDDNYVYQLPYGSGAKYKVTQAANGSFSHKGSNKYAIDWKMPEGTLVRAARGGVVVKVKDSSDRGGSSVKYDPFNNFVLIRHSDGTLGHYCHLQKGGCLVKPGQTVAAGDVLAHSGNTGFSSGPHLHFCVFKTKNGRERESIPVTFQTANDIAIPLVSGRTYQAREVRSASAATAAQNLTVVR